MWWNWALEPSSRFLPPQNSVVGLPQSLLHRAIPSHSLLLSLGTVTEEEESSGEEEHATQDHDEGAEHEGIAQAQELPER